MNVARWPTAVRTLWDRIDGGEQYRVYKYDDRVVKRPKSTPGVAITVLLSHPRLLFRPRKLVWRTGTLVRSRDESVDELKRRAIDPSLFANVTFEGGRVIQDRVTPVKEAVRDAASERVEAAIDRCIDCLLRCWEWGVTDTSTRFAYNYGLSGERAVVIDIGELRFEKAAARWIVEDRSWLDHTSDFPPECREYYRSAMDRRVTLDRLERTWNTDGSRATAPAGES